MVSVRGFDSYVSQVYLSFEFLNMEISVVLLSSYNVSVQGGNNRRSFSSSKLFTMFWFLEVILHCFPCWWLFVHSENVSEHLPSSFGDVDRQWACVGGFVYFLVGNPFRVNYIHLFIARVLKTSLSVTQTTNIRNNQDLFTSVESNLNTSTCRPMYYKNRISTKSTPCLIQRN